MKNKDIIITTEKQSGGNTLLKAAITAAAILTFIPTVFKRTKKENGEMLEGHALLGYFKYEKTEGEDGKVYKDWRYDIFNLDRYKTILGKEKKLDLPEVALVNVTSHDEAEDTEALMEEALLDAFEDEEAQA